TPVLDVEWSPNANYFAIAGYPLSSGETVKGFKFADGQIVEIPGAVTTFGSVANAISWSPDGSHLVMVGLDDPEIKIVSFNGYEFEDICQIEQSVGAEVLAVDWSPTDIFIATGGKTAGGVQVRVFSFLYSQELNPLPNATYNHNEDVYSVEFSPNGKFLAVGGAASQDYDSVGVLEFNGATLTSIASYYHGADIFSVAWSPTGGYLAIGGAAGTGSNTVKVFWFDGQQLLETGADYVGAYTIASLDWSPNGRYLAAVGNGGSGTIELRLFEFDGSSLTSLSNIEWVDGGVGYAVSWTSHGLYLVVGGDNINAVFDFGVYSMMNNPSKCLVDSCRVCNASRNGYGAIGISGSSANNMIIRNICYESDVNVSEGVFNTSYSGLIGFPSNLFNSAVPPY
ncbi:WD40 repeat domain-containing protein, partial [Candidatus Dependentiae bacterium]